MTSTLISFLLITIGAAVGIKFADVDLAPLFGLRHRSAWTHGPLVVYLILYLLSIFPSGYWFAVGFLPAHAIHLLADMFPQNWKGGAGVKLQPIMRRQLAPALSFVWLGYGAYVSGVKWLEITGHAWGWLA